MIMAIKNNSFLFTSRGVVSFSGGGCRIPIINIIIIAKKSHPVKIMIMTAIHPAHFCFSPRNARKI